MDARPLPEDPRVDSRTANDRFKEGFEGWLWGSMVVATALHFAVFALWPTMTAADMGAPAVTIDVLPPLDEVDLPEPPEPLSPPAAPVIATTNIDPDLTITPTTFDRNPVATLPQPPAETATARGLAATPGFVPHTVAPLLVNRDAVGRELVRRYPSVLRDAGIGGTVEVHVFVTADGKVGNALVQASSGHGQLDEAALAVARTMEFTPAMNLDTKVAVWISLPVVFQAREPSR
ncbi:MAG TPA: energy transducer TonB [Longimicrobiales bacterium]|jgi:TonB family protein